MKAQYRKSGSSLYKLMADKGAYVHVYRNDALKSLKALIRAYEELDDEELDDEELDDEELDLFSAE